MSYRTLVIEDEAPAYRRLSGLLAQRHPELQVVDVLDTIEGSVRWMEENPAPKLIFSDIQLSDGLSFEIYRRVPPPCPVIFTTAYDEYMLEAFRANGIDYLLKPIEEEDLARSVAKFHALTRQPAEASSAPDMERLLAAFEKSTRHYRERFLVKLGTKLLPVNISECAYFLHVEGATVLNTSAGKQHLLDQPLDELEGQLDPTIFFRLNRQCIAHVRSIAMVHQHFNGKLKVVLQPAASEEVMVSREKARAFKTWLDGGR
ncbi:MAG: response regulator transcription factor [Flavobacteriales bacterium]|nr:response regulator transcription factor [Flavobacteriales bacterium]